MITVATGSWAGSTVTVETVTGFTVGDDVDDGIRVDYPSEIDLYVERKDGANSDYYNFVGISGTVPDGVSINVTDPFRVFQDAGAPNPAPAQTKPGVLLAGGTSVSYRYDEESDGTHPYVVLAGGYGYSNLTGGTMEFGNFIPADRVGQAQAHFGDTSGYDAVAQGLLNTGVPLAIAVAADFELYRRRLFRRRRRWKKTKPPDHRSDGADQNDRNDDERHHECNEDDRAGLGCPTRNLWKFVRRRDTKSVAAPTPKITQILRCYPV